MTENNHIPLSRTWLEGLSTGELIKLADSYGIDIPPGLERIFIIEELLECSNIDTEAKEDIVVNPSYSETATLPKQYNFSYIDVMVRDPLWIFVFWEIKLHDREAHENADDFNGYFLRLVPLDGEIQLKEKSFTVPVGKEDNARYLGITELSPHDPARYIIKLGVTRGGSELQITETTPFCLPRVIDNINGSSTASQLIHLSGIQDISIIKCADRQSRAVRQ
ncbi:MAG: DUF4912 domain-containing protein [Treponema sp.]|jgi:hypothetical protein|nr:DUF4912 domain-containing protein [Treponema sp.]